MLNPNDPNDPIIPGTGLVLNDLYNVNTGDPTDPDPALLRYNGNEWVGNEVIQSTDTWPVPANDSSFATTSATDARYLSPVTGDVIGGPGIRS